MNNYIFLSREVLIRKIGVKARQCKFSDQDPKHIPDEEAVCPFDPEYSCVSCSNVECPDFGTRWASCPEHIQGGITVTMLKHKYQVGCTVCAKDDPHNIQIIEDYTHRKIKGSVVPAYSFRGGTWGFEKDFELVSESLNRNKMKIYVLDKGVYGSIVVTAKTREEAVKIIKAEDEFIKEERIEEYELEGFIHHNQGDQ